MYAWLGLVCILFFFMYIYVCMFMGYRRFRRLLPLVSRRSHIEVRPLRYSEIAIGDTPVLRSAAAAADLLTYLLAYLLPSLPYLPYLTLPYLTPCKH